VAWALPLLPLEFEVVDALLSMAADRRQAGGKGMGSLSEIRL